ADFNAGWCGPCRAMHPILEELAEGEHNYKIVSIDIDDESDLAEDYDVMSIPCLVLFDKGQEIDRSIGLISKDAIAEMLGV
ncbi:MAG: thioredoxin family protein, partial [Oscillospiraceae bacterium]|nr:thioredoxin family protein [Oscillospiraceae bacterium]